MKKYVMSLVLFLFVGSLSALTIYDVQYTTDPGGDNTYPSTYDGLEVTVSGIVTAIEWKGYKDNFYISMPEGGAWKGILVYMAGDTTLVPGDEIEVTGTVDEYYGMTEISGYSDTISITLLSSGNPIPDPEVITTANLAAEEAYEGVLVELNNVFVTQAPDDHGEWYVTDISATPCQIDDGFFYLDEVDPPIVITVGMEWEIIRGCLDYSYDEYGLNPRTPDDLIEPGSVDDDAINATMVLQDNFPNPFYSETTIAFSLKKPSHVTISVYNVSGQKIRTLLDRNCNAKEYTVIWDGSDENGNSVSSGIYFYKMNIGQYTFAEKMILMK